MVFHVFEVVLPWCRVATPHDVTGSAAMAACLAACRDRGTSPRPFWIVPEGQGPVFFGTRVRFLHVRAPVFFRAEFRLEEAGYKSGGERDHGLSTCAGRAPGGPPANMIVFAARRASCQGVVHPGVQRSVSCSRGCPVGRSYRAASLTHTISTLTQNDLSHHQVDRRILA